MADPAAQIRAHLRPDEPLLWAGRPDPTVLFAPIDAFLIPFSVMWGGFAIFWESGVVASGGPGFFVLWGIPFVLAGLYFMVGRFLYKKWRKLRTAYGLTPVRAIVAVGESKVMDAPVRNVPVSVRRSRGGRHVSITFGASGGWRAGAYYANTGMDFLSFTEAVVAFHDVEHPESLLAALNRARFD